MNLVVYAVNLFIGFGLIVSGGRLLFNTNSGTLVVVQLALFALGAVIIYGVIQSYRAEVHGLKPPKLMVFTHYLTASSVILFPLFIRLVAACISIDEPISKDECGAMTPFANLVVGAVPYWWLIAGVLLALWTVSVAWFAQIVRRPPAKV